MAHNFWSEDELNRYVDVYRRQEQERTGKMAAVRKRLENGYYLSEEAASATAAKMLEDNTSPPPPQRP